ncbi:MAG TPA: hypothetical protein DDW52_06160 [Planctomycetaceae bacterium]|nr:hypothetical protein [Planctomycetaceae bacterium]
MRLYHGTSSKHLPAILRDGILPRVATGEEGNWQGGWQSKPGLVFLTTVYPVYYATQAVSDGGEMVIIEVDSRKLDAVYPDDEYLARVLTDPNTPGVVEEKLPTLEPSRFRSLWQESLDQHGTVCCSSVSPDAIVRHRVLPDDAALWSWMGGDALPSLANYEACGHEYLAFIELFMDQGSGAALELIEQRIAKLRRLCNASSVASDEK